MPDGIKKATFGSSYVDRFSTALPERTPKAINVHIAFEEALKLYFSLGQALAQINSYNRSTKRGRNAGVNLCVYTERKRIAVVEGTVSKRAAE